MRNSEICSCMRSFCSREYGGFVSAWATKSRAGMFLALICASFNFACSTIDLGSTDYRIKSTTQDSPESLLGKYWAPDLAEKNYPIEKGDSITISVQRVFIRDFWEANGFRDLFGISEYDKSGEIVMVVSAGPLERSKPIEATPEGANQGRVIYYAERVKPKTHLPMSSVPIYGPITYEGGPISYSIHLLDLDKKEDARTQAVVRTLASLGSVAYPPSSPILSALEEVGSSLLGGGEDDLIFTHSGVLYPYSDSVSVHQSYLLPGYYVFIRPGSASGELGRGATPEVDWSKLKLDPSTGMLFKVDGNESYTDQTYIVIAIDRGQDPVALDAAETLSVFSERLTRADAKPTAVMTAGSNLVESILCDRRRLVALSLAREVIDACVRKQKQRPSALVRLERLLSRGDVSTDAAEAECTNETMRIQDQDEIMDLVIDGTGIEDLTGANLRTIIPDHPSCTKIPKAN